MTETRYQIYVRGRKLSEMPFDHMTVAWLWVFEYLLPCGVEFHEVDVRLV